MEEREIEKNAPPCHIGHHGNEPQHGAAAESVNTSAMLKVLNACTTLIR